MLEKDFSYTGFIEQLLSVGRLSFTIEEIIEKTGYNRKTVQVSLSRLIQKKKVTLIRRGFYVIITPEFSAQATIPPILYIDDLMQYLKKEYSEAITLFEKIKTCQTAEELRERLVKLI